MKQVILARRYAKAIFNLGQEKRKYKVYGEVLLSFAELYEKQPEVRDALVNPLYPLEVRKKIMEKLVESFGVDRFMGNFLKLLVEKKRAAILPEIAEGYQQMLDDSQNISHGTLVTATELTKPLLDRIRRTLEQLTGRKVVLTTSVDPSIIGGMIATVGDLELDGSIRTQLAGLKDSIKGR
ncbi:MAG: F0F1 ATP synthase subunit delta [Deltaproteobacteria bacterium]|nr:MAG: F0F1 ATP synthase subunit delta [Deltaproteobacteria bacterium]